MHQYDIDSHKLLYHPQRVADWQNGKNIYPLYMELSPSGACNHRCSFCSMDFMGYRPTFYPTDIMVQRLQECGRLGVKAVMFGGEGEPLLHRDIAVFAEAAKEGGMDVAFTTNAVLLTSAVLRRLIPVSSWIKVSCNAGSAKNYAKIHGTKAEDYERVLRNMSEAVLFRQREGVSCILGFQCVLLPESRPDIVEHARRVRDLGADYLVIKPYTHHPQSLKDTRNISYDNTKELVEALLKEETECFQIIFRHEAMKRWDRKTSAFTCCQALPFWAYVDAECNVWGCSRHLKEKAFLYGNLNKQDFAAIWNGPERQAGLKWCAGHLDVSECHITCRMEAINNYLWRLLHPASHDNFI